MASALTQRLPNGVPLVPLRECEEYHAGMARQELMNLRTDGTYHLYVYYFEVGNSKRIFFSSCPSFGEDLLLACISWEHFTNLYIIR